MSEASNMVTTATQPSKSTSVKRSRRLLETLAWLRKDKRLLGYTAFWRRVVTSFWDNRCHVRAAALAYTTLLALVPLLAVSLSVVSLVLDTKSAEAEGKLSGYIDEIVKNIAPSLGLSDAGGAAQRAEVAKRILDFTHNIHFGTIG